MDHKEQLKAFVGEIEAVVERFAAEFDLTMAEAIGGLEIVKLNLFNQQATE